MAISREILAHVKILLTAVYDKHKIMYGYQKGNISTRRKITYYSLWKHKTMYAYQQRHISSRYKICFCCSIKQRMAVRRSILAHDKILPTAVYDKHTTMYGCQQSRPRWLSWLRVRLMIRRSRVQPPQGFVEIWSWNIFYGHSLPSADSRRAVVRFWRKNVHITG